MFKAFAELKKQYQNKKVLILGLGLQGRGVGDARFFAQIGSKVTVTDLKSAKELQSSLAKLRDLPLKFTLGKHREEDILNSDLIIRNASVPWDSPYLELAREKKIPIEMDDSLFAQFCPWPIIGVTGTRGKTTTSTLIYELIKASGKKVFLGGNVYGRATLPLLEKINLPGKGWVVLELSSWQLQDWRQAKISPHLAVFTNFYPDHLNVYRSIGDYFNDKKAILQHQKPTDFSVLNQDDRKVTSLSQDTRAKVVYFHQDDFPQDWKLKIPGDHNLSNAAAAFRVGQILRLSRPTMKSVFAHFKGVELRLEKIGEINGVQFINDSTSTMPEATIAALNSITKPLILIAGGASKNLNLQKLAQTIIQKTKALILLSGEGTNQLKKELQRHHPGIKSIPRWKEKIYIGEFGDLKKAVEKALEVAKHGEVILFSPGFASFGMFANEFDRGRQFNQIFLKIKKNEK